MTTRLLILCTHNSARSILAQAMFNHWAAALGTDAHAVSAGAAPSGRVHPQAIAVLQTVGVDVADLHSKAMDRYAAPDALPIRAVITVCDHAAAQPCPIWPGAPVRVHWSYPDPSAAPPAQQAERFELTRQAIAYRMHQLAQLPFARLDDAALLAHMQRIGGT